MQSTERLHKQMHGLIVLTAAATTAMPELNTMIMSNTSDERQSERERGEERGRVRVSLNSNRKLPALAPLVMSYSHLPDSHQCYE